MRFGITVALTLALCAGICAAQDVEWEDITGGAEMKGWTPIGGEWKSVDGVIVGTLKKTPEQMDQKVNVWLMYEKEYADFELEFECRTPVPTNGGVQFRTHWIPLTPLEEGVDVADAPKDAHGYQANVETRSRMGTGSLIDENGRGELAPPSPKAVMRLKQTGWNKIKIVARGNVIKTYMSNILANKVEDEKYLKGYILLQLRGDEKAPAEHSIEYRNIRVKDYGREGEWQPLFNGENLDGWKEWGQEKWSIKDGAILGSSGPKKSEGYLSTNTTYKDFHVRGTYKVLGEGNFGLFYHSSIKYNDKQYPLIAGVQGEVAPGYPTPSGNVYESYKRGWLLEPDMNTPGAMAQRTDQWNEIEIRSSRPDADGPQQITTWINGVQVIDLTDETPNLSEGFFALQLHSGGVDGILWKDLFVLK